MAANHEPNLAAVLFPQEWAAYMEMSLAKKMPPTCRIRNLLNTYIDNPDVDLEGTTLKYLVRFFETGDLTPPRLEIACADFGYSFDELVAMRAIGIKFRDVALEILSRMSEDDEA